MPSSPTLIQRHDPRAGLALRARLARRAWLAAAFAFGLRAAPAAGASDSVGPSVPAPPAKLALGAFETAALAEMQNLETALTFEYLDTGYFVSLENLNDVDFATFPVYDNIANNGDTPVIRPDVGRFQPSPVNLLFSWMGPYINYQSGKTQVGVAPYDQGSPLDPWGNPYLFFSPLGLIRGDASAITQEFYGDLFDRYTLVSLGADGVVGGDDLFRQFAPGAAGSPTFPGVVGLAVSSLSGPKVITTSAPSGSTYKTNAGAAVTARGYNFVATQGSSKAWFGALELTVESWSATAVQVRIPVTASGVADFTLTVGAQTSFPLSLKILPNAAEVWAEYD